MMKKVAIGALALTSFAGTGSVLAHHSGYMFETTPIWMKGTVIRFERLNPHTVTTLEERGDDGQVRRWRVEGPGQWQLELMGIDEDVPKPGDVIEVCGFPYKAEYSNSRAAQDSDGTPRTSVAGHVLMTPNGRMQFWEPHGTIIACMRGSKEPRQSWLDFLDSSPRVRDAWCEQRGRSSVQQDAALRTSLEELNRLMARPCE